MSKRQNYIVTEVVQYRVKARTASEAERIIENDAKRDRFVIAVTERDAELETP